MRTRGEVRFTPREHSGGVRGCAINLSGDTIVSASDDGTLKVWDVLTGTDLSTLHVESRLYACAFYPDGEHIIAVGGSGSYFLRWVREKMPL
jgi:WD40 repeat protein